MWDGHSCPSPLTLFLILPLFLVLALALVFPPLHQVRPSQTNSPTLEWNSPGEKQTQDQQRRTEVSSPHPSQPKVRIPSQSPALSARRKKPLHHIPQELSRPFPTASPRRRPPALPPRPRKPLRASRRRRDARTCAFTPYPVARRKRMALRSALDPEIAQRNLRPKREPAFRFERPGLARRIVRPRSKIAGKFRRQSRIHPSKPSPPRPRENPRRLPLAVDRTVVEKVSEENVGRTLLSVAFDFGFDLALPSCACFWFQAQIKVKSDGQECPSHKNRPPPGCPHPSFRVR